MDFKQKTKDKAKEYGLKVNELVYLALYHLQIDREDAWHIATEGKDINMTKKYIKEMMAAAEAKGRDFLNALDNRTEDDFDPTDKQSIIRRLHAEISRPDPNQTVIAGLKQISDIQNMRKEENVNDDTTIHYYLPVKCKVHCPLYREWKNKDVRNEQAPAD